MRGLKYIGAVLSLVTAFGCTRDERVAETEWSFIERVNPTLRRLAHERATLDAALREDGAPVFTSSGLRLGFHSRTFFHPDESDSITIDLGKPFPVDAISVVPVIVDTPLFADGAYGFPEQFRIELSREPDFANAFIVFDSGGEPFLNPGRFPVTFFTDDQTARFVRFTSTRHAPNLEHYIWAIGELVVVSGGRNVAQGAEVFVERAPSFPPAWAPENLTDGDSIAALPMVSEASPSNGWLARQQGDPGDEKWVAVDWGNAEPVDELRLVPSRPTDMADTPGLGFPLEYRVEGRAHDSEEWALLYESLRMESVRTSESPVVIPLDRRSLSSVRVVSEWLPSRGGRVQFALAELQVFSGGENLALGGEVSASDSYQDPQFPRWAPEYLVDGFTSQHRLVDWSVFLEGLSKRAKNLQRLAEIESEYREQVESTQRWIGWGTGLLAVGLIGATFLLIRRSRRRRVRATKLLREQISRDLHDEVGSNLGGIALISEADAERSDLPEEVVDDLREIQAIAKSSSDAMRDIIWLVHEDATEVKDLVVRMKATAERLGGKIEIIWSESIDPLATKTISLAVRRHFLLAYKEALHNALRHAEATTISVSVESGDDGRLRFFVRDDGVGFDPQADGQTGYGLPNLQRRAEQVAGSCEIQSSPDDGTVVRFEGHLS